MSASRTLLHQLRTLHAASHIRPTTTYLPTSIHSRISLTPGRFFHATSPNMTVHSVNTYDEFVSARKSNKIVVVDFYATWCAPCKIISPIFEKLSDDPKYADFYFIKVDVDAVPQVAQEQSVRAMPTFMAFTPEKKSGELIGADPNGLKQLLDKALALA